MGWFQSKTEKKEKREGFFPLLPPLLFPPFRSPRNKKRGEEDEIYRVRKNVSCPSVFPSSLLSYRILCQKTVGATEQARTYVPDPFLWARWEEEDRAQIRREKVAQRVRERNRRRSIATKGPPPIACQKGRKSRRAWRAFSSLIQEWKESNDTFLFLFVVVVHTSVLLLSRRESWNEVEWKEEEACAACLVGSWH